MRFPPTHEPRAARELSLSPQADTAMGCPGLSPLEDAIARQLRAHGVPLDKAVRAARGAEMLRPFTAWSHLIIHAQVSPECARAVLADCGVLP